MSDLFNNIKLGFPRWLADFCHNEVLCSNSIEERMDWVIALSAENVRQGTGGPFAAGVFDLNRKEWLSLAVNSVEIMGTSIAHAEILALLWAQKKNGYYDLSAGGRSCELVTSTEPCAMCLGAIHWSGISRLVCGARTEDAERIGFDEGCKPRAGLDCLVRGGVEVINNIHRERAVETLDEYCQNGGRIYNSLLYKKSSEK